MSDEKESDKRYQVGENDKDILTDDIEVLELRKLSLQKILTILRNNLIKLIRYI